MNLTPSFDTSLQDEEKRQALHRMKWIATGMLFIAAIIFAIARTQKGYWWGFVEAFAEASMVGAIADWFAVTALFRHPLGIPIWHTAIIPKQKNRIGASLGNFVSRYFLNPELVRSKIQGFNLAEQIGRWLIHPLNLRLVLDKIVQGVPSFLEKMNDERIRRFLEQNVISELKKVEVSPKVGLFIKGMTDSEQLEPLLEHILAAAAKWIQGNEEEIKTFIKQYKPWYVPKIVYEKRLFDDLPEMLMEIVHDDSHPRRQDIMAALRSAASNLQTNPEWIRNGNELRDKILENEKVRAYIRDTWTTQKHKLAEDLRAPDSKIADALQRGARRLGVALIKDKETQAALNKNAEDLIVNIVAERGQTFADFIAETIEKWDADQMVERVELSIGRDLQFIRINGTIVGGLVGALLYVISHALGH